MQAPQTVLITGASSGIGAALARAYASSGATLILGGRDRLRLDGVADQCRRVGAEVAVGVVDVTDRQAMADWIGAADDTHVIDLVIANAGISAGTSDLDESAGQTRAIFAVNLDGVVNTVDPVVSRMAARGAGQIAIMASLAAFFGFASAPAYCASKAAVRVWGEGLRDAYRGRVAVSVICPGFVRTPMTEVNTFPMPGLMEADRAAAIIRRGLARGRGRIAFPAPLYWTVRLMAALPERATHGLLGRFPRKPAQPM